MRANTNTACSPFAVAVVSIAVVATLGGGCGGKSPAPVVAGLRDPYAACADFEARALTVWNPQIRDEMDFSVHIFNGEILASDAELAVRAVPINGIRPRVVAAFFSSSGR
jgi:hypothetical protein